MSSFRDRLNNRILDEGTWRRAERHQSVRERARLIRRGFIIPEFRMQPQMLVRNPDVKGGWSPEIKTFA